MNLSKPIKPEYWGKLLLQYIIGLVVLLVIADFIEPIYPPVTEVLQVSAVKAAEGVTFLALTYSLLFLGQQFLLLPNYLIEKLWILIKIINEKEKEENET